MAIYQQVTWQPDDEITSKKLQQMCDNTDQVYNHTLLNPTVTYQISPSSGPGGGLGLRGRAPGTVAATKIAGIFTAYDSLAPLVDFEVIVPIPVGFTSPPIFSVIPSTGTGTQAQEIAYISVDYSTSEMRVHLFYRDGVARLFGGVLHILALGH